jgi:hypothetical protein
MKGGAAFRLAPRKLRSEPWTQKRYDVGKPFDECMPADRPERVTGAGPEQKIEFVGVGIVWRRVGHGERQIAEREV